MLYFVLIMDIMYVKGDTDMKITTSTERINELFDSDPRNDTAIAKALGVSKQSVSSWRAGLRSPKKPVLIKIAEEYNVSIEWLMGFDVERSGVHTPPPIIISNADLLAKVFNYMSTEEYEIVISILEKTMQKMKAMGVIE